MKCEVDVAVTSVDDDGRRAQRFISKALTYITKRPEAEATQHNMSAARRERESASSVYASVGTLLATALCYHCPELLSSPLITDYTV